MVGIRTRNNKAGRDGSAVERGMISVAGHWRILGEVGQQRHGFRVQADYRLQAQLECGEVVAPVHQRRVGVDVARRNADHHGRHAGSMTRDGQGVGAAAAPNRQLHRNLVLGGDPLDQADQPPVADRRGVEQPHLGAATQHLEMHHQHECLYFIANYHSLTTVKDAERLRQLTRDVAIDYLAFGLDPKKACLYRQSDIPEVCELTWILSSVTGEGLLRRGTSYKDKVAKGISSSMALLTYPILMAADILIYDSDMVHETPRNIARQYKVPATSIARNRLKAAMTANMVMLGALCSISQVVSRNALEQAISRSVPEGKTEINLEAFSLGFDEVQAI